MGEVSHLVAQQVALVHLPLKALGLTRRWGCAVAALPWRNLDPLFFRRFLGGLWCVISPGTGRFGIRFRGSV